MFLWLECAWADAGKLLQRTLETDGEEPTFMYLHNVFRLYFMICMFYIYCTSLRSAFVQM
jgi:hypothetical protein